MTGLDDPALARPLLLFAISYALTILLGAVALAFPRLAERPLRQAELLLCRLAAQHWLPYPVLFLSVIALRLCFLFLLHRPVPGIHDEFSYLLMADTFAHGRLANPTHPLWISFETFHVNWLPTYSSMYPPAQGFAIAIGQLLGHPWIGILLSCAAMCVAILWMLRAWIPARWALLGSVLVALKFGIASYWINSYWGGAVCATGGALVLGALPRIVRNARIRDALLLGLGIAILANSRPYEGFLLCIPGAIWFLWWFAGRGTPHHAFRIRLRAALPFAGTLLLTTFFMGYYNWRLTGHPLLFPHVLNTDTYHTEPLFLWERAKPPLHYRNAQFEEFYNDWQRDNYERSWHGAFRVTLEKAIRCGFTYLWAGLALVLPVIPTSLRDPRTRFLWLTLALGAAGVGMVIYSNAHYAAPLTCVIYALIVDALRRVRALPFAGRPVGPALARVIVLLLVITTGLYAAAGICDPLPWTCQGDISRVTIAEKLAHTSGKHLIVVRYEPDHNIHDEWVYNGSEIDSAKVIWAREMDPTQNAKLFAYFRDRHIWLVTPDTDNTYLEPYTAPGKPLHDDE